MVYGTSGTVHLWLEFQQNLRHFLLCAEILKYNNQEIMFYY